MSEDLISNKQNQLNYQEQFKRLDRALKQKFYLEAMFIEYAIMEDSAILFSGMRGIK